MDFFEQMDMLLNMRDKEINKNNISNATIEKKDSLKTLKKNVIIVINQKDDKKVLRLKK